MRQEHTKSLKGGGRLGRRQAVEQEISGMDSGATIFCLNIDSPLPSYAGILYLNFPFCKIKIRWTFAGLLATTTGIWMGHAYMASGRLLFFYVCFNE